MYPTSPRSTAASAIVDVSPRTSAFPPPRIDARAEDERRDDEQRHPQHRRSLPRRDRQAAVVGGLGPDRDQVFLLRKPADGVEEHVLVPLDADRVVGGKVGIA